MKEIRERNIKMSKWRKEIFKLSLKVGYISIPLSVHVNFADDLLVCLKNGRLFFFFFLLSGMAIVIQYACSRHSQLQNMLSWQPVGLLLLMLIKTYVCEGAWVCMRWEERRAFILLKQGKACGRAIRAAFMGDDLRQLPVSNKAGFGSITKAMTQRETDY